MLRLYSHVILCGHVTCTHHAIMGKSSIRSGFIYFSPGAKFIFMLDARKHAHNTIHKELYTAIPRQNDLSDIGSRMSLPSYTIT